jgi:hypothetical protein
MLNPNFYITKHILKNGDKVNFKFCFSSNQKNHTSFKCIFPFFTLFHKLEKICFKLFLQKKNKNEEIFLQ